MLDRKQMPFSAQAHSRGLFLTVKHMRIWSFLRSNPQFFRSSTWAYEYLEPRQRLHPHSKDSDTTDLRIQNQVGVLTDRIAQSQLSLQLKLHQADSLLLGLQSQQNVLDASLKSVLVGIYGKGL